VRSRSRRRSLALARRARCSTSSRTEKGASEQEPRAKIRARSLSLALPPALVCCLPRAASRSCALSLVAGRHRWPMGPTLVSGGALYWLTGLGAREATVPPARMAIETATTARAAAPIFAQPLGRDGRRPQGRSWKSETCKRRARAHACARAVTLAKTVDPTRVHNQVSRAVMLAKPCRP